MGKQARCESRRGKGSCGKPAVAILHLQGGDVAVCAECRAEIHALMEPTIDRWAEQLARGVPLAELDKL